jgi:hypothetical protein
MIIPFYLMTLTVPWVGVGDDRKAVEVVCPVDGFKFQAFEVTVSNHWGGRDADGCHHAYKTTPIEYLVWVCPSCGYAGRKKDFEAKLSDEERNALRAGLKPAERIAKDARQNQVPGHVKYDLLAQSARLRKAPPEQVALGYLYASWSCRQQGVVDFEAFDEWDQLRTGYGLHQTPLQLGFKKNRTEFELEQAKRVERDLEAKKYEKGINRVLARYLAAFLYRKHGENADALRWLKELEAVKGENSLVDEAAARMRASIDLERAYQLKAREAYIEAIDSKKLDRKTSAEVSYLIAELYRRTGELPSASSWYQTALDGADAPELKKLAADQKAKADRK